MVDGISQIFEILKIKKVKQLILTHCQAEYFIG